jgi:hypothetical protein
MTTDTTPEDPSTWTKIKTNKAVRYAVVGVSITGLVTATLVYRRKASDMEMALEIAKSALNAVKDTAPAALEVVTEIVTEAAADAA